MHLIHLRGSGVKALSQSHCNFKAHMKSYCHFFSCQFRKLDSVLLDCFRLLLYTPKLLCLYCCYPTEHFFQPLCADPKENTGYYCPECSVVCCLAVNVIVERLCCGNMFTDPWASSEYTRHNTVEVLSCGLENANNKRIVQTVAILETV